MTLLSIVQINPSFSKKRKWFPSLDQKIHLAAEELIKASCSHVESISLSIGKETLITGSQASNRSC